MGGTWAGRSALHCCRDIAFHKIFVIEFVAPKRRLFAFQAHNENSIRLTNKTISHQYSLAVPFSERPERPSPGTRSEYVERVIIGQTINPIA